MRHIFLIAIAILLPVALAERGFGQDAGGAEFDEAHLEQIAGPVALYPDSLLMQVFMAATYPLEVVEADRWIKKEAPTEAALEAGLKEKGWDPSVKSLCTIPDVLSRMSENLDWTRDMGDAFLGQQAQLLDAVQRLRGKAQEAGNLETTPQQTVTVQQDKIIVIEPAQTEVVYVPTYSPTVVYGTMPYTTVYYAPLYAPPPPGHTAVAFAAGVVVGAALWGNCSWGWGHSNVNINVNHYNNFNRNTNNNFNRTTNNNWQHNSEHRKGVNYRNRDTAQKFGGGNGRDRASSQRARGYDRSRGSQGNRTGSGRNNATSPRQGQTRDANRQSTDRNRGGAYNGSRNPKNDRAASKRGSSSRSRSTGRSGSSRGGGGRSSGRSGGGRSRGGRGR